MYSCVILTREKFLKWENLKGFNNLLLFSRGRTCKRRKIKGSSASALSGHNPNTFCTIIKIKILYLHFINYYK